MGKITVELIRKRAEHNEGDIQSLEEISLHQEKLEKIELLDRICRNLKILMLQNNSISKIENVSRLKNLEYLNLALNMVEVVENLEGCESLKKLDLTLNFVGLISSVESLRPNYYLEALYLVGNPCHEFPGYRQYVITVLPQLKYLDGVEITKSERIQARQNFEEVEATVLLHQDAYLRERNKIGTEGLASQEKTKERPKTSKKKPKTTESKPSTNLAEEEEDDTEKFWQQVTENTPETRREMNRRLEQQEAQKTAKRNAPAKPKPPRKLVTEDGRPLNVNEPKVSFILHDEVERNQIILDLALAKFLCTTLIDADVQPTYVRVAIKDKVFQLVLPEEVRPDSSYAQRSQTTGHLIITMPKVHENSTLVWRGGSGHIIDLTKTKANKSSPKKVPGESKLPLKPKKTGSVATMAAKNFDTGLSSGCMSPRSPNPSRSAPTNSPRLVKKITTPATTTTTKTKASLSSKGTIEAVGLGPSASKRWTHLDLDDDDDDDLIPALI